MGPELQGLTHKAMAYWSSCIIEAALRPADIGRHSSLFLWVYTLTCPVDQSSNNQTQAVMINIWLIYLIAAFWLIVYMIVFVSDNTLLFASWVEDVSLNLCGWKTLISDRFQAVSCQAFCSVNQSNPLKAAYLKVWPLRWCFQHLWKHLTLQRIEPPCPPLVSVTWTWTCEQTHRVRG